MTAASDVRGSASDRARREENDSGSGEINDFAGDGDKGGGRREGEGCKVNPQGEGRSSSWTAIHGKFNVISRVHSFSS